VRGRFTEVRGAARDLDGWLRLQVSDDTPPFQRLESISDPATFTGRLRRNHLDQITTALIELTASEHTIYRGPEHIQATPDPSSMVIWQLVGSSVFQLEDGRRAELLPGYFTFTSLRKPYTWSFGAGANSVFSLRFPAEFLDLPRQVLQEFEARPLTSAEGFGRHLAPFVRAIAYDADLLRGPAGARLARNLIDLFATGMAELLQRTGSERSVPFFMKITDYIAGHLADPELDASAIARAHHVSVRSLQALFQEQGTTVTDWIRARRLAGCRRDLADPALRDFSIADIALRWGYQDPAYFARRFRTEFGETPREWRSSTAAPRGSARLASPEVIAMQRQPGIAS
jgi:AraC-like DNA-binding protein